MIIGGFVRGIGGESAFWKQRPESLNRREIGGGESE